MIWKQAARIFLILLSVSIANTCLAEDVPPFDGRKKCSSCHKSQYKSWKKTAHAKALSSLQPKIKSEAKLKAGLDPDKDYSEDKKCIGCHVTGFEHEGGYDPEDPSKYLIGVSCEMCHGPGSEYRLIHRKAGERFERKQKTTARQVLADAGEEFHFLERCKTCHVNYKDSPWKGKKEPYTPFTPEVDPKYTFDFEQAVRDEKAMHEHFTLDGTFTGPPLPDFHDEFQKAAKSAREQ